MQASPTIIARRFGFVREAEGPNAGTWVSLFQRFTGNRPGNSWCASFVSFVLDVVYRGQPPLRRSAVCTAILADADRKGLRLDTPRPDCLYFYVTPGTRNAHHVGIVTSVAPLTGIAGNTSEDGLSANGTGVFEHEIAVAPETLAFVLLP
jgi:hypothetical protein